MMRSVLESQVVSHKNPTRPTKEGVIHRLACALLMEIAPPRKRALLIVDTVSVSEYSHAAWRCADPDDSAIAYSVNRYAKFSIHPRLSILAAWPRVLGFRLSGADRASSNFL